MVSAGSVLHLVISGNYGLFAPTTPRDAIASGLVTYPLQIRTFTFTTSFDVVKLNYEYVAALDVQTTGDYDTANDILNTIQGVILDVLGSYPASGSVTSIVAPSGRVTNTNQPSASSMPGVKGPLDTLGDWFGVAADTLKWILIAIVGLIVLVLLILGYGTNVPKVARAVA
jgi:hypothetical protein